MASVLTTPQFKKGGGPHFAKKSAGVGRGDCVEVRWGSTRLGIENKK